MGVKISSLPVNALPYTGSEKIPLVQGGETKAGTLSSFVNYLSGSLSTGSALGSLSGNWQNTYTTFSSNSANYAVKNTDNNFTTSQSVTGTVTSTVFTSIAGTGGSSSFKKFLDQSNSFGIGNLDSIVTDPVGESLIVIGTGVGDAMGNGSITPITNVITIGNYAGGNIGNTGAGTEIIGIGSNACSNAGQSLGSVTNNIGIGFNACYELASNSGTATEIVAIGTSAGEAAAKNTGLINDVVFLGSYAGFTAGDGGLVDNLIAIGKDAGNNTGINTFGNDGIAAGIISIGQGSGAYIGAARFSGTTQVSAVNIITLGKHAGSYMGSGNENTALPGTATEIIAIGTNAGYSAGSGGEDNSGIIGNSVMIGNQAGYYAGRGDFLNGSVSDLIAIGQVAGYQSGYQTTSNNNIFIGLSSGYNKQGSRNTFIGDLTNTSPTSAVNLSGCIAIGYGARPTARNTIAFGSTSTPLSVVPGGVLSSSLSGFRVMINGTYYTIPLLA